MPAKQGHLYKGQAKGLHDSSHLSHIAFDFWKSLVRRCFQREADGPRWASALGLAFLEALLSGGLVIKEVLPNTMKSIVPSRGLGFAFLWFTPSAVEVIGAYLRPNRMAQGALGGKAFSSVRPVSQNRGRSMMRLMPRRPL